MEGATPNQSTGSGTAATELASSIRVAFSAIDFTQGLKAALQQKRQRRKIKGQVPGLMSKLVAQLGDRTLHQYIFWIKCALSKGGLIHLNSFHKTMKILQRHIKLHLARKRVRIAAFLETWAHRETQIFSVCRRQLKNNFMQHQDEKEKIFPVIDVGDIWKTYLPFMIPVALKKRCLMEWYHSEAHKFMAIHRKWRQLSKDLVIEAGLESVTPSVIAAADAMANTQGYAKGALEPKFHLIFDVKPLHNKAIQQPLEAWMAAVSQDLEGSKMDLRRMFKVLPQSYWIRGLEKWEASILHWMNTPHITTPTSTSQNAPGHVSLERVIESAQSLQLPSVPPVVPQQDEDEEEMNNDPLQRSDSIASNRTRADSVIDDSSRSSLGRPKSSRSSGKASDTPSSAYPDTPVIGPRFTFPPATARSNPSEHSQNTQNTQTDSVSSDGHGSRQLSQVSSTSSAESSSTASTTRNSTSTTSRRPSSVLSEQTDRSRSSSHECYPSQRVRHSYVDIHVPLSTSQTRNPWGGAPPSTTSYCPSQDAEGWDNDDEYEYEDDHNEFDDGMDSTRGRRGRHVRISSHIGEPWQVDDATFPEPYQEVHGYGHDPVVHEPALDHRVQTHSQPRGGNVTTTRAPHFYSHAPARKAVGKELEKYRSSHVSSKLRGRNRSSTHDSSHNFGLSTSKSSSSKTWSQSAMQTPPEPVIRKPGVLEIAKKMNASMKLGLGIPRDLGPKPATRSRARYDGLEIKVHNEALLQSQCMIQSEVEGYARGTLSSFQHKKLTIRCRSREELMMATSQRNRSVNRTKPKQRRMSDSAYGDALSVSLKEMPEFAKPGSDKLHPMHNFEPLKDGKQAVINAGLKKLRGVAPVKDRAPTSTQFESNFAEIYQDLVNIMDGTEG